MHVRIKMPSSIELTSEVSSDTVVRPNVDACLVLRYLELSYISLNPVSGTLPEDSLSTTHVHQGFWVSQASQIAWSTC